MMVRFITLLIGFIFVQNTVGQKLYFKNYNLENGLSNNSVNTIVNDESGALWIATWDGLNYYDGFSFRVFKNIPNDSTSIAGNEIRRIVKDSENKIWVLTNESVSRYLGNNHFKNYYIKGSDLFTTNDNKIAVAISKDYTYIYNGREFVHAKTSKSHKKEHILFKNTLLSKYPNLIINDILIDNDIVYFATRFNGLFTLKVNQANYKITQYTKNSSNVEGFKSNEVEKIHKDIFGGVWLAFKDGGISLLQKSIKGILEIHPSLKNNLPSETIRAITKDNNDNLWLGYYNKGLYHFDQNTKKFNRFNFELPKNNNDWNRIRSVYKDTNGTIWVGTYAGIIKVSGSDTRFFNAKDEVNFPNNRNYSFFEDKGFLWIACWGGIAKFNLQKNAFESFPFQEKLNDLKVRNIIKEDNKLIIATENKSLVIFELSTGSYKMFTKEDGIISNSIFSVLKSSDNNLWIATLGGVSILDENYKLIKNITEKNGLKSHMTYGLLQVDNKIWINTSRGISQIDMTTHQVNNIELKYWQEQEFSEGAYYKDKNNKLFYGGIKRLIVLNSKEIVPQVNIPKLKVTIDGTDEPRIQKPFRKNYFKATITPILFEENNNPVFFKLKNYDKDWIELSNRTVFYKDIPAGTYEFVVKSSVQSKHEITRIIVVKKPFYMSDWFLTLIFGITGLGIILFLYLKNRSSQKFQQNLQKEVTRRTVTIEQQKKELQFVHNKLRDNSFEVEKFKNYIITQLKQPLNVALNNISDINIYPEKKEQVYIEIKNLMNRITKWDYLNDIGSLPNFQKKVVQTKLLSDFINRYHNDFEEQHIVYDVKYNTDSDYIEIDIVKYKLMLQYLVQVLLSYAKPSKINIEINVKNRKVSLFSSIDNTLLIENIQEIKKYNSYYRAFIYLVQSLGGTSKAIEKEGLFSLLIEMNIDYPNPITEVDYFTKNSNFKEIPEDKKVVLVYSSADDFNVVEALLEDEAYHIVFEENIKDVSKYLAKTKIFDLVIFYNVDFSSELIKLSNFIAKSGSMPTIYISEKIDYTIQEQAQKYFIDDVIQLPVSKRNITNKMSLLIGLKKTTTNNYTKSQKNIKPENQKIIDKAIAIIEEKYSEVGFNVEMLIDLLQVSKAKCYRVFKEVLLQTPSDYMNQFRMEKSLQLLKEGTLNISQIAFECGFNDPKYFSKAFKKYYGKSPKNIL